MDAKKRKTYIILTVCIVLTYIVYGYLWLHAAYVYEDIVLTAAADQIATEITVRNICEMATYVLFLICSWYIWDNDVESKYTKYLVNMSKIILLILGLGCILTIIQYIMMKTFSTNYLLPVLAMIFIMFLNLLLVSGMQAKKDIR